MPPHPHFVQSCVTYRQNILCLSNILMIFSHSYAELCGFRTPLFLGTPRTFLVFHLEMTECWT